MICESHHETGVHGDAFCRPAQATALSATPERTPPGSWATVSAAATATSTRVGWPTRRHCGARTCGTPPTAPRPMAEGAPVGAQFPGAGYPEIPAPPLPPDFARGEAVFADNCALCHGDDGQGQRVAGRQVFPPLWGPQSYNWGAGMHQLDNAAGFIKANMPLGRGGSLTDQQAWDVAMFMNAHERPQDPRFTGSLDDTREKFHNDPNSLYGLEVDGRLLGSNPSQ